MIPAGQIASPVRPFSSLRAPPQLVALAAPFGCPAVMQAATGSGEAVAIRYICAARHAENATSETARRETVEGGKIWPPARHSTGPIQVQRQITLRSGVPQLPLDDGLDALQRTSRTRPGHCGIPAPGTTIQQRLICLIPTAMTGLSGNASSAPNRTARAIRVIF